MVPTTWRLMRARAILTALALMAALGAACRADQESNREPLTPDLITRNNRGVALMGQYDFGEAAKVFDALATDRPDWNDVHVNLAIALLNQQGEGELARAERILRDRVLTSDANHRRGRYVLGLLLLYSGRTAQALPHFRALAESDPPDGFAAYFAGRSVFDQQPEEALAWYRRAIAIDPLLRSAYYGAFQSLQRLRRDEEGRDFLQRFQDLDRNPQATTAEFKYTRMGPLSEAVTVDLAQTRESPVPVGAVFAEPAPLLNDPALTWQTEQRGRPASVTTVDLNHDGQLDVFVSGALAGAAPNAVLIGQVDGTFRADAKHALAGVSNVHAALWGDYDNDGMVDVLLCRGGGSQLWRQTSSGVWRNQTREAGAAAFSDAIDGAMFDADHDGDLDIWLIDARRASALLNNNGDGTFRRVLAGAGGDVRGSRGLAIADLDADRDADVIIINRTPPHDILLNDRAWQYRRAPGADQLAQATVDTVIAGDTDADGHLEIYTDGPRGIERWTQDAQRTWQPARLAAPEAGTRPVRDADSVGQLALSDVDGDGTLDLLASRGGGWVAMALSPDAASRALFAASGRAIEGWALAVLDSATGPSVVGVSATGAPVVWRPGPGRHRFLTLTFSGRDSRSDQLRSNVSGIGVRAAVRTGSRWTAVNTWRWQSGPGQALQPVAIGLGGARQADFVVVTWADGVLQTEMALASSAAHRISETQRQLSSCPVLFAFDGQRFAFVTDLLGVGGIGFLERPGVYGEPYPQEHVLVPADRIAPKDGRYQLKIGEPMEEITYLDAVWLSVYDLPPGWQMTLDERKALVPPMPTGEARFFTREMLPSRATNDRGEDVTAAVQTANLVAAPPGTPDPRFIGRTADHALTFEFDRPIDGEGRTPLLVISGWIEYPYAQTIFAAWQAGAPYRAPTLEARDATGRWRPVLREFGYPAGMPREMSVPLPGLPRETRALRLSTSQEIFWDRLAVVHAEPAPEVRHVRMPVATARLDEVGFARRTTGPQRTPTYDYAERAPLLDTRHQRGWYTAFGSVEALVTVEDGAVAIFGPGEEVHLEFEAPPPPPAGWTRRVVLETRGWCKDMDLYTRDGDTVEPLPGAPSPARDRLHKQFNTRYDSGR